MSHIPYRTGITTIMLLLRKICEVIVSYKHIMLQILPEPQHVYVEALEQACNDFILNVSNPRPGDE